MRFTLQLGCRSSRINNEAAPRGACQTTPAPATLACLGDGAATEHLGNDDERGDEDENERRYGGERRVHLQEQVVPHLTWQGRGASAGNEQRYGQIVE